MTFKQSNVTCKTFVNYESIKVNYNGRHVSVPLQCFITETVPQQHQFGFPQTSKHKVVFQNISSVHVCVWLFLHNPIKNVYCRGIK